MISSFVCDFGNYLKIINKVYDTLKCFICLTYSLRKKKLLNLATYSFWVPEARQFCFALKIFSSFLKKKIPGMWSLEKLGNSSRK